ncbi:MAG TPA: hypothetical protein PKO45_13035 [Rubrivivax sp.]|nr:hypothetical protein [Rubrivivax sp.]
MSMVKVNDLAKGVVRDAMPEELPDGAWSRLMNVSNRDGFLLRSPGMGQLFAAPSVTPYFVAPFRTAAGLLWVHAGLAKAFVDNASTRTDITRTSDYTGAPSDRWVGGAWNGGFVLNNGRDKPQWWDGDVANKFVDLPNWTATKIAKVVRGFRRFLVALDVTSDGTRYPFRVLWSALADPGSPPPSWDLSDATREAGEVDIVEAAGPLVDALPLGEQLIIYSPGSMHAMREIGGPLVMSFTTLPGRVGMLARNCAVDTPLGHVVLTNGDVIVHQGGAPRSIAAGRVRGAIFDELENSVAEQACFVAANPAANEVWVCYPTDGSGTCRRAAVWNWAADTWSFRDLPRVTAGGTGQTPLPQSGPQWSTIPGDWTAQAMPWGGKAIAPNDQHLVLAHAAPALSLADASLQDLGADITATAERIGMHLGQPDRMKLCRGVWPRIDGPHGEQVQIQIGAAMRPDQAPTWQSPRPYTIGSSEKVDGFAQGRYLALRLSSTGGGGWRLRGLELDVVPAGRF